jgi:molybdate transport system ATP-binding protein
VTSLFVRLRGSAGGLALDLELVVGAAPLAVVGPNGAGKTTLLLAILGLADLRGASGRVALDDRLLFDSEQGIDCPAEERGLAYVPQDYALFPHLSAIENVEFALACRRPAARAGGGARLRPAAERRARALALLEGVGAGPYADRRPATLSGGERQRVALARALATDPRALLFDEPFAALDVGARQGVRVFLRERLSQLALPSLIVTHDRDDVEAVGAEVVVLEGGRVAQRGTLGELERAPATPYVARFCAGRGAPP